MLYWDLCQPDSILTPGNWGNHYSKISNVYWKDFTTFLSFSDTDIDGEFLRTCKTLFDQILECDPAQLRLGSDFLKEFLVRI